MELTYIKLGAEFAVQIVVDSKVLEVISVSMKDWFHSLVHVLMVNFVNDNNNRLDDKRDGAC